MLEKVLCSAFDYENHLPPVKQKSRVGWWPKYTKEYLDEPEEPHGSIEAYNFYLGLALTEHQRKVIYAFFGKGEIASDREALRIYSRATVEEYNNLLALINKCYAHEIKRLAVMF